jgi:hypothetical protein
MPQPTQLRPIALRHLLEIARVLSVENHSDLVLCMNALPWMDMAVSADDESACSEGFMDPGRAEHERQRRWREVARFLDHVNEAQAYPGGWCHAVFSFGLVRCWPTHLRSQAHRAHGPFGGVIDCQAPWRRWMRPEY